MGISLKKIFLAVPTALFAMTAFAAAQDDLDAQLAGGQAYQDSYQQSYQDYYEEPVYQENAYSGTVYEDTAYTEVTWQGGETLPPEAVRCAPTQGTRRICYTADGTPFFANAETTPAQPEPYQPPVTYEEPVWQEPYSESGTAYGQPEPLLPDSGGTTTYREPVPAGTVYEESLPPVGEGWEDPAAPEYSGAYTPPPAPPVQTYPAPVEMQPAPARTIPAATPGYLDWPKNGVVPSGEMKEAKTIRRLVEDGRDTLNMFARHPGYEPLWENMKNARAVLVAPRLYNGGFIFGGSGANMVMLVRGADGGWSQPAFYTIGAASVGLQAGGQVSETVLLVMTDQGLNQMLSDSIKLGGDATIAAGGFGAGAKAQTTDIVAWSRSKGLYAGISLEGAVVKKRKHWNAVYYGRPVSAQDILIGGKAYNPNSAIIQDAARNLANVVLPPPATVEYR